MINFNRIKKNIFHLKPFSISIILIIILGHFIGNFNVIECADDDEDGPYLGRLIGTIRTYHHQVAGTVYAVDEYTLYFSQFVYDGSGADTFFWAGVSSRPGPQGFIVPDENKNTNILEKYFNKDFTLTLPESKKITEIRWFAIYDLNTQNDFGDILIPEHFEPPQPQLGGSFWKKSHGISSGNIEILDSKTIRIPEFIYDGLGKNTFFIGGIGPQPTNKGIKIPDEMGYLDPIRRYDNETITLELQGEMTIFKIDWISVYDLDLNENFGSVLIPSDLNVPPSLIEMKVQIPSFRNCRQLHKNLRVSWDIAGPAITFELSGQVNFDEYMSFGISGSEQATQMLGADVAVAYLEGFRGYSVDYDISSLAPCVQVLGQNKGVCRDDAIGGQDNFQLLIFNHEDGIQTITYRRSMISSDSHDKEYILDKPRYMIWAMGRLDSNNEPSFHDIYPKKDVIMSFNTTGESYNDCFNFSKSAIKKIDVWDKSYIIDRTIRSFKATLGPAGGKRAYEGITGHVSNGLAWYINGLLIPELWLKRGLTYAFKVHGGNNPHSPEYYHPFVITDEPRGGFDRLTEAKQNEVRVLAGVEFTRRGRPKPTAAGPLCLGKHASDRDRRLDDTFSSFKRYNRTLLWSCEEGKPAILEITPNSTWPDIVYYNSFTHANMGWKIHIVDNLGTSIALRNSRSSNDYNKNSIILLLVFTTSFIIGCNKLI